MREATRIRQETNVLEKSLMPYVGRTAKLMNIYMKQRFTDFGVDLTPKQWIVLKHLIKEDGREQNHLALITERDKTSLTRLISTMEKKGLVRREASKEDKRVNRLFITSKGENFYSRSMPIITKCIEELHSGISKKDLEQAIGTMRVLHNNIKHLTTQNHID